MARNMKIITSTCACCKNKQTIEVAEYDNNSDNLLTMMEYNDFKFVPCNVCENCGYANIDISKLIGENSKAIVDSEPYKFVLDNGFIDGYKDLSYQEYLDTNVAQLDAMAMLYESEGEIQNLTYARLNDRIANIKASLRGEYSETMYGLDDDDEEFLIYQNLIKKLTQQINDANKKCYETLISINISYPYEIIFAAECLTKQKKYDMARKLISNLKKSFSFGRALNSYIENFLTEVEVL